MASAAGDEDRVRALQRTLYRAAKAEPGRRFHALYDKVWRPDVLARGWEQVKRNRGAAGIDRQGIADVEAYGVERVLEELAVELREERYRPQAARRVWIPKPGRSEKRPLGIPTIRDRIVQAAVKLVVEPVFEADFVESSYGYRPGRSAHDALQVLIDETWSGRRWVVETDIGSCFEAIPHEGLMAAVEERIVDRALLRLVRGMLRAGVMEDGRVERRSTGTPQGGVLSPLLANVYLHRLDRAWQERGVGRLVRYADDLVVLCHTEAEARQALVVLAEVLAGLGLELNEAKTRIVQLAVGGEGLDFLGFHHRWVQGDTPRSRHLQFLARWPSQRAMGQMRTRIREMTDRRRLRQPLGTIVADLNRALLGWTGYFRYGNSAHQFAAIHQYAMMRLALMIAKRDQRSRKHGWAVLRRDPEYLGLLSLEGVVVTPRPYRRWQG